MHARPHGAPPTECKELRKPVHSVPLQNDFVFGFLTCFIYQRSIYTVSYMANKVCDTV